MPTKEETIAEAENKMRNRVFAKMLRNLPNPAYLCAPTDDVANANARHTPAGFTMVEWRTDGTSTNDNWWCDACELPIRNDTDMLKASANGKPPLCAKCESPLVDAGLRRPVVVKVRLCLRCGLIFWDRMEV